MAGGYDTPNSGLTRAALRNSAVRLVVGGFAAMTIAEWILGTAVAVHAYSVGGALMVGLVGFRFAPAAIAGLWTTQLADHPHRHRTLALSAAARTGSIGLAVVALALNLPFGIVVGLIWLDAAAGTPYRPTQAALLPELVRTPGELTAAASLISNIKTSGQLLGALIGGILVGQFAVTVPVIAATVLYGLAVAMAIVGDRRSRAAGPWSLRTWGALRLDGVLAGVEFLRHAREARSIALYACGRSLVRGLWLALVVVAALKLWNVGGGGVGLLMAAAAAGAFAGIGITARLVGNRRLAGWFQIGLGLCGLPILAAGLADTVAPVVVLMVLWGIGMSLSDVGAQALLNRIVPANAIGRVTGVMETSKLLFEGVGSLVAPALVALFGERGALFAAGAILPIAIALGWRRFVRIDDRALARVELLELLQGVPFFAPLRLDALEGVASRLKSQHRHAGEEIVVQGEVDAHQWYLVADGELEVEVEHFVVGELHPGSQFGERALLRGMPRSATVRAVSDVLLFALEREDFLASVAGMDLDSDVTLGMAHVAPPLDPSLALAHAPLLHNLEPEQLGELCRGGQVHDVPAGTAVVTRGDEDDTYHVMLSGRADVVVDGTVVTLLFPGDAFGEIAVLHRIPRTASVITAETTSLLTLDGEAVRTAIRDHGGALAALIG
jgi:CRP-like cAMP-binding protein/MFS family permease